MQRITISLDDELAEELDKMAGSRAYNSRSEALRDIVRDALARWGAGRGEGAFCVANLSYVYDRRVRKLAERLAAIEHEHHDLVSSSTDLRLDHYHSLVSVLLKGPADKVEAVMDHIAAERGVRSAKVNLIAVQPHDHHDHPDDHHHHGHNHLSPTAV